MLFRLVLISSSFWLRDTSSSLSLKHKKYSGGGCDEADDDDVAPEEIELCSLTTSPDGSSLQQHLQTL